MYSMLHRSSYSIHPFQVYWAMVLGRETTLSVSLTLTCSTTWWRSLWPSLVCTPREPPPATYPSTASTTSTYWSWCWPPTSCRSCCCTTGHRTEKKVRAGYCCTTGRMTERMVRAGYWGFYHPPISCRLLHQNILEVLINFYMLLKPH